jgi:hypothetical protein
MIGIISTIFQLIMVGGVIGVGIWLYRNDMLQASGGIAPYHNHDTPKNVAFRKRFKMIPEDYTPDYKD